ncbi:hypothetical protein AAG906_018999 [Vitis piasezkii]
MYRILCFLFFLSYSPVICFSFSNSTKLCPHHQNVALLRLKQLFSIDVSASSSDDCNLASFAKTDTWKEGTNCCSWDGVTCNRVTGLVIGLDLSCNSLFLLPHLRRLNLAFNDFNKSSISAKFGQFRRMTHLNLSFSGFSGVIAPEISHLSNLVSLDLSIYSGLGLETSSFIALAQNPTKLRNFIYEKVWISRPAISRFHSSVLGNLTQITHLDLSRNQFDGEISNVFNKIRKLIFIASLDNLTKLSFLDLSNNNLEGIIPSHVKELSSLSDIHLSNNLLNGTIPSWLFSLPSLIRLDLGHNKLNGHIDEFQSLHWTTTAIPTYALPFLETLLLSSCNISEFPRFLCVKRCWSFGPFKQQDLWTTSKWAWNMGMETLSYFNLSQNLLTRFERFPWKNMLFLDLHSNLLQGPLPSLICEMSYISVLDFSNNNLSGLIPQCLGNFSEQFYQNLGFNGNQLEGPLPLSLINCRRLQVLDLGNNRINDTFLIGWKLFQSYKHIPSSLGNLMVLESLDLSSNKLSGRIPRS